MLPQSLSYGAMLALVAVAMLWRNESGALLVGWFSLHLLLSAWRLSVLRRFDREQAAQNTALDSSLAIRLGCLASGFLWGLLAMLPYPPQDVQVPLFMAFCLAGVTAGGANAMAAELGSALLFQLSIFSVFATRLLIIETDAVYHGMGISASLYSLFMALWTLRMHLNAVAAIRRQLDGNERERQLAERETRYRDLAHHDALTGLPNRLSLEVRMPDLLATAAVDSRKLAVVYIDLDHFKDINDSRGHRCGDLLLANAAVRLRECVRRDDLVVRMGGDEFVVVASHAQDLQQIEQLAQRLAASISQPLTHEGDILAASATMGIAVYPDHGTDADQLLKNADIALYQAKAAGRGGYRLFASEMSVAFHERIFLERALTRAIGTEQLFLEYQPLIDLTTGRLTGLEALLRWRHPERGLVSPLVFIPIAEHCGLIDTIGAEVLKLVCQQLRDWQSAGLQVVPVAVNVSPTQFEGDSLVDLVLVTTDEYQVSPSLLQIEITETALMKGTGQVEATLRRLRELGVKVLIDDFGIGFSSLNHLKNLAIDGLKVDRSFVQDMIDDERDAAIVAAIVDIAKNLELDVLAEGVESSRHIEHLLDLGCRGGQGHFLHEPIIAEQCSALLQLAANDASVRRSA